MPLVLRLPFFLFLFFLLLLGLARFLCVLLFFRLFLFLDLPPDTDGLTFLHGSLLGIRLGGGGPGRREEGHASTAQAWGATSNGGTRDPYLWLITQRRSDQMRM